MGTQYINTPTKASKIQKLFSSEFVIFKSLRTGKYLYVRARFHPRATIIHFGSILYEESYIERKLATLPAIVRKQSAKTYLQTLQEYTRDFNQKQKELSSKYNTYPNYRIVPFPEEYVIIPLDTKYALSLLGYDVSAMEQQLLASNVGNSNATNTDCEFTQN